MIRYILLLILTIPLLSNAQLEKELVLLDQWSDPSLPGSNAYDNTYNEVWGMAVNGKEYAVIGSTFGTHIFDVTEPTEIVELHRIPGKAQGGQIIHRDYHDFDCYLYCVSDEGPSSLQIVDISNLDEEAPVVYDSDKLSQRTHNIFIDSADAKLYAFATSGTEVGRGAMQIFDLSQDPTDPTFIATYNRFGDINAGHVHDAYVHEGIAYLNCGFNGFAIVDFTDPLNPNTLNTLLPSEYPGSGYNHSCWGSTDGSVIYMADETWDSPVKVIDVTDPSNISVITTIDAGNDDPFSIPHNQVVACDYLYVSYYYDGIQVYDISNPGDPIRSHYYSTSKKSPRRNYEGSWGVYPLLPSGNIIVSDMQEGLFIFESLNSSCNDVEACSSTSTARNLDLGSLEIYPNPTSDITVVRSDKKQALTIYNLLGKIVHQANLTEGSNEVNLGNFPPGTYILKTANHTQVLIKE